MKVGETTVRGREYPWGVVEIENEQHCDFVKLREMLIRTNMEDLREVRGFLWVLVEFWVYKSGDSVASRSERSRFPAPCLVDVALSLNY